MTLAAAGFIPVAVLGFIVEFQGESAGRVVGLRRFATATALATVAVAVSPLALMPAARVPASRAGFVPLTGAGRPPSSPTGRGAPRPPPAAELSPCGGAAAR